MKSHLETLVLSFIFLFSFSAVAQSSSGGSWAKRAQARESKRWTLQEWLDQKNRNALMDQWLTMNSPSPFEFSLQGDSYRAEIKKTGSASAKEDSGQIAIQAFAGLVGLMGAYENSLDENLSESTGLLQFRLLGGSLQTTSFTIGIGQRTRNYQFNSTDEQIRNLVGQAVLQMYLTRHFGIKGTYRYFSPTDDTEMGKVYGHMTEGGVFLDFSGVRIYGDFFDDVMRMEPSGSPSKYQRRGIKTGLQFFF